MSDNLTKAFAAMPPDRRARFLARIALEQTIHARAAYDTPESHSKLVYSNEFIHRLVGHAHSVLSGKTTGDDDASFMRLILEAYGEQGLDNEKLRLWLTQELGAAE